MKKWVTLLFVVLNIFFISCSTKGTITSKKHNREHINRTTDSIYILDSIFIYVNGDTVRETRVLDRWRDRIIRDTVWCADTIPEIITIYAEKPLNFWERIKLKTWPFVALIVFIWCFIFIIKKRFGAS